MVPQASGGHEGWGAGRCGRSPGAPCMLSLGGAKGFSLTSVCTGQGSPFLEMPAHLLLRAARSLLRVFRKSHAATGPHTAHLRPASAAEPCTRARWSPLSSLG